MMLRTVLCAAVALGLTAGAIAQEKKLRVGDAAPGLDVDKWVKGEEIKAFDSGKVYVVEFWATWCGPCKASIPNLSELQRKFEDKGLTIIGISTDDEKTVKNVVPFVRGKGEQMAYTVAIDKQDATKRAWMEAASKSGIPCAFIVDRKGKIAWIGNPHPQAPDGFEETLKKVMTGRYDPKLSKQADPVLQAGRSARKVRNWLLANKHYDEVINLDPAVFAEVGLEKFEMMLIDMDDRAKAYDYARNTLMGKHFASDAGAMQMLAEKIAGDPKIDQPKRDMDLALELAEAARRVAGANDPTALACVADVRFRRGEVDQAIELQKQAYFIANPKNKAEYKRTLSNYQEAAQRNSAVTNKPS